jgi:hypothetical protein
MNNLIHYRKTKPYLSHINLSLKLKYATNGDRIRHKPTDETEPKLLYG